MLDKITECLYYRAWASFLHRIPNFRIDYTLLLQHKKKYPATFKILTSNDINRIEMMDRYYRTGQFLCFSGTDPALSSAPLPILEKTKEAHKELVRKLYQARVLDPYTDGEDFVCNEFPVAEFGNIDLVIYSKNIAFAIEVKTIHGDHSIIGQILKYYIGLSLNLVHKFYNDVKLITICPGYDKAALLGLRQMGVQMLLLNPNSLMVSLIN